MRGIGAIVRQSGATYRRRSQSFLFRAGDVRHSQADIGKAKRLLDYAPTHDVRQGFEAALPYYIAKARSETDVATL